MIFKFVTVEIVICEYIILQIMYGLESVIPEVHVYGRFCFNIHGG